MNEPPLLRLDPDEKLKLDEKDSVVLISTLTSPMTIIEIPTKSYVDRLHENNGNRRDLLSVFKDQLNEFGNKKLTNLDSVPVSRNPDSDFELASKNYTHDSKDGGNILRFNQTLENCFKVSLNDVYNITKYDRIQIYKLLIQQKLNVHIQVVIFCKTGL